MNVCFSLLLIRTRRRTDRHCPGQLFGNLLDNCFNACVDDFTSKALSGRENGCLSRCVMKSMTTQTRLSERFAEQNQAMTAELQKKF